MPIMFTTEEAREISGKLEEATKLLLQAEILVRRKDDRGESELSINIDSNYNDITDTLDILWRCVNA